MNKVSDASCRLLSPRELARALSISVSHVKALTKDGRIPEIVISKNTRRYQLDAVLDALGAKQPVATGA